MILLPKNVAERIAQHEYITAERRLRLRNMRKMRCGGRKRNFRSGAQAGDHWGSPLRYNIENEI